MGSNPLYFSSCGDDCPVERVSWENAQAFIEKLNLHENANRYSLPTEAQWEYAARAGSTTALANGNLVETNCSLDTNLNAMGIAEMPMTKHILLPKNNQMHGAYMICMAMCGNGVRTGMVVIRIYL